MSERGSLLILLVFVGAAWPQAPAQEPTALFEAFRRDRAAAAGDTGMADRLAARAEAALAAGNRPQATRLIREARWALPARPANLPDGVRVLGFNRFRHDDRVNFIRFNADGTRAVSGSNDGTVRIWDVDAGQEVMRYTGHAAEKEAANQLHEGVGMPPLRITDAIFLPDGATVASADRQEIHLWEAATGRLVRVIVAVAETDAEPPKKAENAQPPPQAQANAQPQKAEADAKPLQQAQGNAQPQKAEAEAEQAKKAMAEPDKAAKERAEGIPNVIMFKSLAVNGEGTRLAAGSDDKRVRVWETGTGRQVFVSPPHSSRLEAIAWQPGGSYLAAVDADGFLCVYDPADEQRNPVLKVQVTDASGSQALAVCFSPDGTRILTGGVDGSPRIIPAPPANGAPAARTTSNSQKLPAMPAPVQGVAITPDSTHFIAVGPDADRLRGRVQVMDALGSVVRSYSAPGSLTAVAVRPNTLQIAAASEDGGLYFWHFQPNDDHFTITQADKPLWATAVNQAGTRIAAAGADKIIRIHAPDGQALHLLEGSTAAVTALVWLDDNTLLSAGGDKQLRVWDAQTGQAAAVWPGHAAAVLALAASADGRLVVSGAADRSVQGWDPRTGQARWNWTAPSPVAALAVSPDQRRVVVGTADGGLAVLAIKDAEVKLTGYANAHLSGVGALAFNTDGSRLLSVGGDGLAKLWSITDSGSPSLGPKLTLPSTDANRPVALSAAAFSPDGSLAAVAGADRTIYLFDAQRGGAEQRRLRGCADWVTALAFLPDGDRLAAVAADHTLRIFDLATVETGPRRGHLAPARTIALSPSGKLASGGDDRTIRIWNPATCEELASLAVPEPKLYALAFLDDDRLASGGSEGKLRLWNLAQQTETSWPHLQGRSLETGQVYALAFSRDRSRAVIWSPVNRHGGKYKLIDAAGRELAEIADSERQIMCLCVSPDLTRLAAADHEGKLLVWNLEQPNQLPGEAWSISDLPLADIGFSPDGQRLYGVDTAGQLHVADVAARNRLASRPTNLHPTALLVAPAGQRVAVLGTERMLTITDQDAQVVKTFQLPSAAVGGCFAPDGRTLFTANADGSLYVIDVP